MYNIWIIVRWALTVEDNMIRQSRDLSEKYTEEFVTLSKQNLREFMEFMYSSSSSTAAEDV